MKKTAILALILAILVGFYFTFLHNSGGSSVNPNEIAFAIDDTSAVTSIRMQKVIQEKRGDLVLLEKRSDGAWMIGGKYMAQRPKVTNLLTTLNLLQLKENLTKAGRTTAIERLKAHHIEVIVAGKDGNIREYLVGSTNKEQTGNIMMLKEEDVPYVMARGDMEGYVSIYFSTDLANWRENLVFNIPLIELKRVSIEYPFQENSSFTLSREAPEDFFGLLGEEKADSNKISQFLSAFQGKTFAESYAAEFHPNLMDSLVNRTPDARFYYELFDGESDTLRLFNRPENLNNFFGYLSSRKELLTVQHFVFDKFLKKKESFALPTL